MVATISHNGGSGGHRALSRKPYILEEVVNFATIIATPITVGTTDTVQVLKIPANSWVSSAGYSVLTAEATNTTTQIELGDGVDTDRWVAAATVTTVRESVPAATTSALGQMVTSADTVDILISVDDPVTLKVKVWAVVHDLTSLDTVDYKTYTSA
jgi:hypothetical protein